MRTRSHVLAVCIGMWVLWRMQDGPFLVQDHATEHLEALHGRDIFCSMLAHTKQSSLAA